MPSRLTIEAEWEQLDRGSPEERACFAALGIQCDGHWLTEGLDGLVKRTRPEPLLSAYHLAEWLAWNWWRLRWEPRSSAAEWALAHRMATIGHGYVWPNITIYSDGERTALIAKPTAIGPATAFRYISDHAAIIPSASFEGAVDAFVSQVLGQLQAERIAGTNLQGIWSELTEERQDRDATLRRRLEALLGHDPDEADHSKVERLIVDARTLGEQAAGELAAEHGDGGAFHSASELRQIAEAHGFSASPRDAVRLAHGTGLPVPRGVQAWQLGAEAARALRSQQDLGTGPVSNDKLAQLAGVNVEALTDNIAGNSIAFALDHSDGEGRVVLRSRWETGRRFEVARLLADRIVDPKYGKLHAATRTYTYRQKMQRSFAAELLAPFEIVDGRLEGDYSAESQRDMAAYFNVSERTIWTLLVNHKRLDRDGLEEDCFAA